MAKNRITFTDDFVLRNEKVGIGTTDPQALLDVNGTLKVSGVSTFASNVDINASIDVDGHTELDDLNVTGVSTFGDLYVNGALYDANNSRGNLNEVLVSVGAGLGVTWKSLSSGDVAGAVEVSSSSPSTPYYIIGVEDATGVTSSFYTDTDIVLTGDGRLGIGTTNPTTTVDITGDVKVSGLTTTQNLYVTGVSTFISEANFNNNVNITGTVGIGTIIYIVAYDTLSNGTLSFEGSEGQLFSITNNLTSGSIFSVNDVSGIPSIDVDADGTIQLAPFGSAEYVGVGKTNPTEKLDVAGNVKVSGVTTTQNLYVTGVSTFINDPVLIGSGTSTGTTAQRLQVTGGAYISGNLGIGTTNPQSRLDVLGDVRVGINTSQGLILTSPNGTTFRLVVDDSGTLSAISTTV